MPPPHHMGGGREFFPPGFPFHHRESMDRKDKSFNDQLKLTKKCYKMVEKLGGEPEKYEDFVKPRLDKKFKEILEEYLKENNIDSKKFDEEKVQRKSKKLGFYYKKEAEEFKDFVRGNIELNLQELIKIFDEKFKKVESVKIKYVEKVEKVE